MHQVSYITHHISPSIILCHISCVISPAPGCWIGDWTVQRACQEMITIRSCFHRFQVLFSYLYFLFFISKFCSLIPNSTAADQISDFPFCSLIRMFFLKFFLNFQNDFWNTGRYIDSGVHREFVFFFAFLVFFWNALGPNDIFSCPKKMQSKHRYGDFFMTLCIILVE